MYEYTRTEEAESQPIVTVTSQKDQETVGNVKDRISFRLTV